MCKAGETRLPGKNDLYAWGSVMSLPRVVSLTDDGALGIEPAPELKSLRLNPRRKENIEISGDQR